MKAATITPPSFKPHPSESNNSPPNAFPIRPRPKVNQTPKRSQADKRIDFLLQKHFDDDPDFRPLILELAELDPTPKKKYLAWLVKHWTGKWNPTDADLKRVARYLETHHKGAKYFSPLSWTGLLLEDVGYHADIFQYTPESLATLGGRITEIIRIDEEDKQIRKGNLVVTGGAEVAYKDDRWTVLRVRTQAALRRLGQGCGWCVCAGGHGYGFPFDFLLNDVGERYLAHHHEIADRWNRRPPNATIVEINRVRKLSADRYDRVSAHVDEAIKTKIRHEAEVEKKFLEYPDLAIRYAEKVIRGRWEAFEKHVRVATLSAHHATDYAIKCRCERWPRFENKIKRSAGPLRCYRSAFPGAIPKTEEEIFQEKLNDWRAYTARAKRPWSHSSIQWQAESRDRNVCFEDRLLMNYSEASIRRYARLVASLATSKIADAYRMKILSYFTETEDEQTQTVNDELGPIILERLQQRIPEIEPLIGHDPVVAFAYATGIRQRFLDGEVAIKTDPGLWWEYTKRFVCSPQTSNRRNTVQSPRFLPPQTYKVAWG
ncbi:hypothetical protein NHH03_12780 [Stieleria sp. TO1_6]|uniref:hypothetical protein n=1 Tax=Stieleria tagensis TaxID=2956795 RepID=UPI00209AD731|nr:hypothetical protein [Stieleria tagensis]MCO8122614.1 hypothetical protein [Stieleria tagensis]